MQAEKHFIDFAELISPLLRRKLPILICMIIGFGSSIWNLHNTTRAYTVSVEIQAAKGSSNIGINLANLGAVSSLLGVPLEQNNASSVYRFEDTLFSREIGQLFISRHPEIIKDIFTSEWSESDNIFKQPTRSELENIKNKMMHLLSGFTPEQYTPPNAFRLTEYFRSTIKADTDTKKNRLRLYIETSDTVLAKDILGHLTKLAQNHLLEIEIKKSENIIRTFSSELKQVRSRGQADAIATLISNEQKKLLFLKASGDTGFDVLYDPEVSLKPTYPNERNTLIIGGFLGFLFGIVYAFSLNFLTGRKMKR